MTEQSACEGCEIHDGVDVWFDSNDDCNLGIVDCRLSGLRAFPGPGRELWEGSELVGVLAVVFLQQWTNVEIVAPFGFSFGVLDGDIFVGWIVEDVVGDGVVHHVEEDILMLRLDDIPCVLLILAGTGRDDGHEQIVELVLPDVGKVCLALLAQGVDEHHHLAEIKGVVGKGFLSVGYYGVTFLTSELVGAVEDVVLYVALRRAVGIVVLLKHVAEVEMAVLVNLHQRVVALEFLHEAGVIVLGARVECLLTYFFEVRFLAFELVYLGRGSCCEEEGEYEGDYRTHGKV